MHWKTIDAQGASQIKARRGALLIEARTVSLTDVTCLLTGESTALTASVLSECSRFGVPILHCDWRSVPVALTLPWSSNTRVAARHKAQAELSQPRRKAAWALLMRAKIRGQGANLARVDQAAGAHMLTLSRAVRSGDPDNVEAQAAAFYWRRLALSPDFHRKAGTRRGPNGALDYGYTILRGALVRSIVEAGLWPTLGLWHHSRSNVFCLADDLIEPFRPAVDYSVMTLPPGPMEDPVVRKHLAAVLTLPMTSPVGETIGSAVTAVGRGLAGYVEGGDGFLPPVWSWPSDRG